MKSSKTLIYLIVLSFLFNWILHFNVVNLNIQGIHSWRQSQTMWNVRNFQRNDANILNPRIASFNGGKNNIYRYEFPYMQWGIAMVQKIIGDDIFYVRLMMFLITASSTYLFFLLLLALNFKASISFLAAMLWQFSPVLYYYSINPLPDLMALTMSIGYLLFIIRYINYPSINKLMLASIFLTLATLAKLPFLMFSIVSIIYFFKHLKKNKPKQLFLFFIIQLLFLIPTFVWYAWVMPTWKGNGILTGIFANQVSFSDNFYIFNYHLSTMFPMRLLNPISAILFLTGIFTFRKSKQVIQHFKPYLYGLILICFLYLALQFNMINVKHDYYMFPFLPWLYIFVAFGINHFYPLLNKRKKIPMYIILVLYISTTIILTFDNWKIERSILNKNVFIHQQELKNLAPQDAKCIILNDRSGHIFSYLIDKQGHIFNENLEIPWIKDMIKNHNVEYMYSDSEKVNSSPKIIPYISEILFDKNSIKVFKFKHPSQIK